MKNLDLIVVVTVTLMLSGCATSHPTSYSVGREFPSENLSKIVKGKTTSSDLVRMFGEPYSKTVVSESEEKWIYTYSTGTASVQREFLAAKVQTTGQNKTLDVLLKNGTVTNFTYSERSEPPVQVK
jgi:outer membrane protein assembly factor BamE (lipoprotein component of BamABCDE complex)